MWKMDDDEDMRIEVDRTRRVVSRVSKFFIRSHSSVVWEYSVTHILTPTRPPDPLQSKSESSHSISHNAHSAHGPAVLMIMHADTTCRMLNRQAAASSGLQDKTLQNS